MYEGSFSLNSAEHVCVSSPLSSAALSSHLRAKWLKTSSDGVRKKGLS